MTTEIRCQRPGCSGKIVDGVCEDCGRPPVGKSVLAATSANKGSTGSSASGSGNTGTTASRSSSFSGRASSRGTGRGGTGKSTGRSTSSRRALGAGLVSLPEMPSLDPLKAIMENPVVPDRKRFCNNCDTKLNHEKGFCPNCGHEYSFLPTLKAGDVVGGQYEVKGAIAFGGLGWIYLAWDKTLSRWVVLKGLLNSKDEAGAAAAVAERQFLAAVKHPKIVGVYNFVNRGTEGYIVMEYVGGKTIKAIRQERGPLPVEEAIAYIHGILPAFAYLERMGMVYCDFKPDNFMLEDDDVKLIDMGGVRRVDDTDGDIYGTKGYSAPEANDGPTFVSDLFTVGRTLAILMMDFKFQGAYEYTLPPPAEQPLFAEQESLYRFLKRSTAQNPDDRFQNADEMADQLVGVLREIVAVKSATPRPAESTLFTAESAEEVAGGEEAGKNSTDFRQLPNFKVDPLDPAANLLLSAGGLTGISKQALFERAVKQFPDSAEAPLRLAELHLLNGNFQESEALLTRVQQADAYDWRVNWYRGLLRMAQGRPKEAVSAFDAVYNELPGELAPKMAIALASEIAGDFQKAIHYYDVVSRVDPNFTTASFGLARCQARIGQRDKAVDAFLRVAPTSSRYTEAQMALARVCIQSTPAAPGEGELVRASQAIEGLTLDGFALHHLSAELFLAAISQLETNGFKASGAGKILGQALEADALREGAERELRSCARYAKTREDKIAFVDRANEVRPRTLT